MDSGKLLTGVSLFMAQVWAMFLKKYIYTKRNWILLVIQNAIPLVFIVMTMLVVADLSGQGNLGSLKITMASYAQTVTVLQSESFDTGSLQDNLIRSYTEIIQSAGSQHTLSTTTTPIQDFILGRYAVSVPRTNMDYMFGASITNQNITAWFNNQALHTIPLTINIIHNALLR